MFKVAAFTSGQNLPGSRFRVRQHILPLKDHGIELSEFFTMPGAYPPRKKWIRPFWGLASLASRLPSIAQSYRYDVTLFQREMLSTFTTLEPFTKRPRILDVDDAIWLAGNGAFARRLATISDSVICGNTFLADYFNQWNHNITVLPTAVDTDRFLPSPKPPDQAPIIGWSGGENGFADLRVAESALRVVLQEHPNARLRVIADEPPNFLELPASQVEFVQWSPESEVRAIQSLDIGIMPLRDIPWSRGKCAYKMLLYMSCGVPVVGSPLGMTGEVLKMSPSPVGIAASTTEDWIDALKHLLSDTSGATAMGQAAREIVLRNFSIEIVAPQLATEILRVAGRS